MAVHGLWDSKSSGIKHVYDMDGFQGIAGRFRPTVLDEIRKNSNVAYIEPDQVACAADIQKGASWGLARISHRNRLTFATFNRYEYDPTGGDGVTVFLLDTGINTEHNDFEGRASWGTTILPGESDTDENGHGTHCAGIIGGKRYGVSKKVKLVAVKVLGPNGCGLMTEVVAGVDFAVASHLALKADQGSSYLGSVANLPLGGGHSATLNSAVTSAVESGLHTVVAAGNDKADACESSPAAASTVVTVGATGLSDESAYFSNYGPCVDIFGPGLNIASTYIGSSEAVNTLSGTSQASAHIAGLIAYFLSLAPKDASAFHTGPLTPQEMKEYLLTKATSDVLLDIPEDTANKLAFNGYSKAMQSL